MKVVSKQKVSEHKRTRNRGVAVTAENRYVPKSVEGLGMYTFVIQDGKRRYSVTKHCSEHEADLFVKNNS